MTSQKNAQAVRVSRRERESKPALPERRVTFGDVIAEKLQGSTVSIFDVKRSLKFARDTSLAPEDRVKIIDALSTPNKEVLPLDWSNAVLGNIARKDDNPDVRVAASKTLFHRKRK